jgi:hypothetical protein
MRARWVSQSVLGLARTGAVTGEVTARFGSIVHAQFGDFVVALMPPGAPRMPNGISIGPAVGWADAPEVGHGAELTRSTLEAGRLAVEWDPEQPPLWDAHVVPWRPEERDPLRARACAILGTALDRASPVLATRSLARVGGFAVDDPRSREALEALVGAVRSGDPGDAARAGRALSGRGGGLPPIGDDMLAAAALTMASAGAVRFAAADRRAWISALAPPDLRARTTALSATLLELAIRGHGIGPACELLDPAPLGVRQLRGVLAGLRRVGHTTGAAYAATIGAVALLMTTDENRTTERRPHEG